MTTLVVSSSVTEYVFDPPEDTLWATPTTITLAAQHGGYLRKYVPGLALEALHDGCVITNIKVEFTASYSGSPLTAPSAKAQFPVGVAGNVQINNHITPSSLLYSANGGAGLAPSVVRAGFMYSNCFNNDTFYNVGVNMSLPIITITYIDNGLPSMLQFSL